MTPAAKPWSRRWPHGATTGGSPVAFRASASTGDGGQAARSGRRSTSKAAPPRTAKGRRLTSPDSGRPKRVREVTGGRGHPPDSRAPASAGPGRRRAPGRFPVPSARWEPPPERGRERPGVCVVSSATYNKKPGRSGKKKKPARAGPRRRGQRQKAGYCRDGRGGRVRRN